MATAKPVPVPSALTLEEKTLLDDPLAVEACQKCGIELQELHPLPLGHFVHESNPAQAAEHSEKRRQYKWRLIREELGHLQRKSSALLHTTSSAAADTRMERMRKSQEIEFVNPA